MWSDKRDEMIQRLQEQMGKLQEKMEQMEKRIQKTPDASDKKDNGQTLAPSGPTGTEKTQTDEMI